MTLIFFTVQLMKSCCWCIFAHFAFYFNKLFFLETHVFKNIFQKSFLPFHKTSFKVSFHAKKPKNGQNVTYCVFTLWGRNTAMHRIWSVLALKYSLFIVFTLGATGYLFRWIWHCTTAVSSGFCRTRVDILPYTTKETVACVCISSYRAIVSDRALRHWVN